MKKQLRRKKLLFKSPKGNACIEHPERMIEDERMRNKLAEILYEYWYVLNGKDNQDAVMECVNDLYYLYFSGKTEEV